MDDTHLEAALTSIWNDVLQIESVGPHEHFLDLGGNSISAFQLLSKVHERCGIELSLREFFTCLTIAELADELKRRGVPDGVDVAPAAEQAGTGVLLRGGAGD